MRAAVYCRLSEEDRDKRSAAEDSGSIQNQKAMLLQYAAAQGWEVYDVYSDDDYAGADRNRPAFNRLLADAEAHRFDIVLCKTQSRFTREMELVEKYLHGLFPAWGVRFVSVVDNADTANKGNKKARQINGLVNEWYLEDMSENIRSVLTSRRQSGLHIGAFALYGYKKDPAHRGRLLVDAEAAAVVREIFTRFAAGEGMTALARELNARGVPSPAAYKRQKGLNYHPVGEGAAGWRGSTVSAILHNRMYTGDMVQGRYGSESYKTKRSRPRPPALWYVVPGTHAPLVEPACWQQVQERLAQRAPKHKPQESAGLFAGKVWCAACGSALCATTTRGRRYLQCAARRADKASCPGAFVSAEALEGAVRGALGRLTGELLEGEQAARARSWLTAPLRRAVLEQMVERIEVGRRREGSREVPVTLFWRF